MRNTMTTPHPASNVITSTQHRNACSSFHVQTVRAIGVTLSAVVTTCRWLQSKFYYTPLFLSRLENPPKQLLLDGIGMPTCSGPLDIQIGENCWISPQITFQGRTSARETPQFILGSNSGIGWRQGIYVGSRIVIGNNVLIAGEGALIGYPGHPLDPDARRRHEPEGDSQARDIIIEDDVWIGRRVIVSAGVMALNRWRDSCCAARALCPLFTV